MGEVCAFLASQKLKFHSNQRWISTASADFIFPSAPKVMFSPGRKTPPKPHHTGHGPFRTRPPQPQLNSIFLFSVNCQPVFPI